MKKLILIAALIGFAGSALAQSVTVSREAYGSGQPNATGVENATKWENDIYHAPQYMPGYPTAAIIYPRIVDVQCTKSVTYGTLQCKGYNWSPEMGRGEYLMIHTVITQPPAPVVITNTVTNTIVREIPVTTKKIAE